MFQSGSQINAGLGRTDYSAYTQGAAQGAQAVGQGVSNLVQGVGVAVKEYLMNKEKKALDESAAQAIKSFAIQNPEEAKSVGITDPTDSGMVKHLVKSFGGAAPTLQAINSLTQMKQQKDEFGMKRAAFDEQQKGVAIQDAANLVGQGYALPAETDPRIANAAYAMARQQKQQAELGAANLDLIKAKTTSELRPPKPEAMPEWKAYLNATPEQQAKMRELKQAASSKTEVTTVPGIATQGFKTFEAKKDKVLALESTAQAYADADKAIGEGAFTGTGAKVQLGLAKIGQAFGFNDWDNKIATTEFLRARLAQPTLDAAQVFPGALSDGDRKFLVEAANGSIDASPATIKRMMDIARKTSDKAKKGYVSDVERVYGKGKETHDPYALSVLSFGEQHQEPTATTQDSVLVYDPATKTFEGK